MSILLFFAVCAKSFAQAADTVPDLSIDSVRVSLLTCQPRQEIYALYGHSAIRIENPLDGTDIVVNYGMFTFSKSFFALRFMFGLTDYEMSLNHYFPFALVYKASGSGIRQQVLNLTAEEKWRLLTALNENYLPENRVYRYNFYYDNCTTRARDMIERCIDGQVDYHSEALPKTYRALIHEYNEEHPWARLGNDMLLGVGSDREVGFRQQQFLPEYTMRDFSHAQIVGSDGSTRPLVTEEWWASAPGEQVVRSEFPLRPSACAWLLFAFLMLVSITELFAKKRFWQVDALVVFVMAACALIITAMIFSQHPTVKINFQILLFNPILVVGGYSMVKAIRRGASSRWIFAYIACLILFSVLGIWQKYAEGAAILSSALLLRYSLYLFKSEKV